MDLVYETVNPVLLARDASKRNHPADLVEVLKRAYRHLSGEDSLKAFGKDDELVMPHVLKLFGCSTTEVLIIEIMGLRVHLEFSMDADLEFVDDTSDRRYWPIWEALIAGGDESEVDADDALRPDDDPGRP